MTLPVLPVLNRSSATFAADVSSFFGSSFPDWSNAANAIGAAMALNDVRDVSSTSATIGVGAWTFFVSPNKSFQGGMYVTIADAAAPTANSVTAQITSYNPTTGELVVNSILAHGTGTKSSWLVAMTSDPAGAAAPAVSGDISVTSVTSAGKIVSTSPSAGIGYATGAGGAVTTSSGLATLNKICGAITLEAISVGGYAQTTFTITNSAILSTKDIVAITLSGTQSDYFSSCAYVNAVGSFSVTLTNLLAGSHNTGSIIINFAIFRNVIS